MLYCLSCLTLIGCRQELKPNERELEVSKLPTFSPIKIKEIFSQLVSRDAGDRVYSGQILSEAGLADFEKTYGIHMAERHVDFRKQMLIFGVTDNITTRASQLLRREGVQSFTLDYVDLECQYRLRPPEEGKKYSHLQVFILDRIDGIPHVKVRNYLEDGLSRVYDKKD